MEDSQAKQDHPFTVFTLGRICGQKGSELFNAIAERMPDVQFLWVGDGDLRDELNSANITVTGWADRPLAISHAINADVFLLTSRWEGLPISLLEAMYMRKPCIVSDVIGNRDVIRNGENGYICRTTDEFVSAIENAHSDAIMPLIETAYQEVLEQYQGDGRAI